MKGSPIFSFFLLIFLEHVAYRGLIVRSVGKENQGYKFIVYYQYEGRLCKTAITSWLIFMFWMMTSST